MLRLWYEKFDPSLILRSRILDLLEKLGGKFSICFAATRENYNEELAHLAKEMEDRGIEFCLWPLLPDELGYWISTYNAEAFLKELKIIEDWASRYGVSIGTLAVDLEPPLVGRPSLITPSKSMAKAASRWKVGVRLLSKAVEKIHELGAITLAPMVDILLDLDERTSRLLQIFLGTPVDDVEWDIIHPMIYNSMHHGYLGLPYRLLRARMRLILEEGKKKYGEKLGVSIGVIWIGKLGNEPMFKGPKDVAIDAGIARALGIKDIGLYNLEGIIFRKDGVEILKAFLKAKPFIPRQGYALYSAYRGLLTNFAKLVRAVFGRYEVPRQ